MIELLINFMWPKNVLNELCLYRDLTRRGVSTKKGGSYTQNRSIINSNTQEAVNLTSTVLQKVWSIGCVLIGLIQKGVIFYFIITSTLHDTDVHVPGSEMRLSSLEQTVEHQTAAVCGHQWWPSLGEWTQ